MRRVTTRRRYLALSAWGTAGLLAACATPQATPSPVPAAPASTKPAAPTAAPKEAPPQQASQKPPQATQAPAKKEASVVRFATSSLTFMDGFRRMALHKGFFKEGGLDVQATTVEQGGSVMVRGLVADQFDVAAMGPDAAIATASQGGGVRMVSAFVPGLVYGIYSQKKYNSLLELKGKEIGVAAPGSLLESLLQATLFEMNLDPNDFPKANVGGSPSVFKAVIAGKVEAGVSNYDFLKEAEASPNVKLLLPLSDVLPKYITIAEVAGDSFIKNRPEALQEFINQQARGVRYAMEHKEEAVALAAELLSRPVTELAWEHDYYLQKRIANPDGEISPDSLDYQQNLLIRLGQMKERLPRERIHDGTFVKKMLDKVGRYKKI